MKIRRITLEVEVPWNAEYETALTTKQLDGDGVLKAFQRGMSVLYEDTTEDNTPPHQAQVVSEEESPNTQIGEVTTWPPK